ncbi:MAG TPA: trehalose-phosphatase [Burkholderiales bacterium]|nr:trehalose-phosphatase [Burkholderiales bacterium]
MSAHGQRALPPVTDWALFLDVDGTLLEHAARPDAVRVAAPVHQLLEALRLATRGALALISGRAIDDIDALFAPLRLPVAGQHGAERRDAAGRLHRHQGAAEPVRRAAARLGAFAARHAGLVFEDKGHNLALHYRQAPAAAQAAQAALRAAALELGGDYEVLEGKMVVELKPAGRDKGRAIAEFMAEAPFAGRTPVFIGDDVTDEFGFGVVNRLDGHSVKVGPGASAARHRLADAAAVREQLAQWAAQRA